ncbi:E3 ubiquitin-protein ligase SH3RF2 isoform X2 [Condylostylus longicornis]|uniref:E3 ubiquitin-protein ligase SH3RF2 isoform X2 n=1 Tax=Condylostylus longicornis TaxID=2530218 RepID=UPI00244DD3E4|nr:E3 ubiquitin-protein ligase SH3RF2 isoform X2 [Condylostylus longicornis]
MDTSTKHGVSAIVEYDYNAKEPDEIDLIKGAIIHNIKKQPGGWWLGTLASNGKTGMFPDNFVRVLDNNEEKSPVVLRPKSESIHRKCKVVYSYTQNNEDELTLAVGDIIDVLGVVEEGWWRGKLNDKIGVFPSNFVVPVEPSPILANRKSNNLATVPAPAITTTTNSIKTENRSSLHSSNENLIIGSGISAGINSKINKSIKDKEKDVPLLPPKPMREFCRVMFPYEPQNDDELELQVGDIIQIQSKELPDKGWWRGELKGKIGVFPDNFVTLLPPDAYQYFGRYSFPCTGDYMSHLIDRLFSPNKDSNNSSSHSDRPPSGTATNSSKVFIKKSGSGSSTQSSSNRKDSFGSRDSLNDILSETGLQTGNVAAQRKSLESKNLDLTNNAGAISSSISNSGSITDVNNITSSTPGIRKTRNSMDSANKNSDLRKSLENIDEKKTPPPVLGKKPIVPVKKSTSVTSVAGNIISGIKHKVKSVEQKLTSHDTVDGITASKATQPGNQLADYNEKNIATERVSINKDGIGGVEFDNVERSSMLGDMRASRVKAPKRRPPSAAINIIGESNNNNNPVYLNGSGSYIEQYEGNKGDSSPTSGSTEALGDNEELVKPKPREWEKMKAPWMAELKASQEKKKTSPNVEPRPIDRVSRTSESEVKMEKMDSISTTKVVNSNTHRKSSEASYQTSSIDGKRETSSNNIVPSVINTNMTNSNNDMTKSVSALKASISQDIDDVKLRPNSLSIRNRSTSPSGRTSLNKATSLDVQNVRASSASSSASSLIAHNNNNNINHQSGLPPQSSTISSTNSSVTALTNPSSTTATTTTATATAIHHSNNSLPISQDNVSSRVIDLEQRLNKLESIVHSQSKIIENLVRSLREETDKVKGLKTELDKYAQCVTQV